MAVIFIKGDDPALLSQTVQRYVGELVGDGDRGLMVEEVAEPSYGEPGDLTLGPLVNAAQTLPFLTDRRVVLGRNLGLFSTKGAVAPLVALLDVLPETTDLVLVWETGSAGGRMPSVPKSLLEALSQVGAEMIGSTGAGRGRKKALDEMLASAPVKLDASARKAIADNVGDELGQVLSLMDLLASTFGLDASLTASDVKPFLGVGSDVPPWELTDAIDRGDIGVALERLGRMQHGGRRHPLQTLATLHTHYQRALRLQGAGAANEKDAASILGMGGSTFPAKKALELSRRLGPERLSRAVQLLAQADLDTRGATASPGESIMEVLVARLARLST